MQYAASLQQMSLTFAAVLAFALWWLLCGALGTLALAADPIAAAESFSMFQMYHFSFLDW